MNEPNGDKLKDLRKALQLAVCKIVFHEDREQCARTTRSAITALTELTFQYATKSLIPDLHTFSSHANRKSTISPDDVAVALRKLQPDLLETFKSNFCRSGNKMASKSNTSAVLIRTEENRRNSLSNSGHQSKKKDAEILSLSSSSSSSDDSDCANNIVDIHKQEAVGKYATGLDQKSCASDESSKRPSRGTDLSIATKRSSTVQKFTKTESLLNKFKLRSDQNSRRNKEGTFNYDTSSTDDEDTTKSPPRSVVSKGVKIRKSVEQQQAKKKSKPNTHGNKFLSNQYDDSTDDDVIFLQKNAIKTKGVNDNKMDHLTVNRFGENNTHPKSNRTKFLDLDDDKHFGMSDDRHVAPRIDGDGNVDGHGGTRKQSQVEEALANLSSDSGTDEDDTKDKERINARQTSSSIRQHLRIESDDDDD